MTDEQMLQAMKSLIDPLREDIAGLKEDVSSLKDGQNKLEQTVTGLDDRIRNTNTLIENDIRPKISLIAEQHGDIVQKLSSVREIDEIKSDVQDLKRVVTVHTAQIQELQRAQA